MGKCKSYSYCYFVGGICAVATFISYVAGTCSSGSVAQAWGITGSIFFGLSIITSIIGALIQDFSEDGEHW